MARAATTFPRAATTFVGRQAELDRILELLGQETLFLVYGVGGIGKSELVYSVIERARATRAWTRAPAILVPARTGAESMLAHLRLRLGGRGREGMFDDDLEEVAARLEAKPSLVFLDDLHTTAPEEAGRILGFLARHVRRSRIFAASRAEIPLPPGATTPVVTRLGPLAPEESGALAEALSERLGVPARGGADLHTRSGGSPFHLTRLVAGGAAADPLADAIAALGPTSRRALLVATFLRGRIDPAELDRKDLAEAERHFLADLGRDVVIVHDLVRDALLAYATADEIRAARKTAAEKLVAAFAADPRERAADALDAVQHLVDAEEPQAAWTLVSRAYGPIAASGLDHLLLPALAWLREQLPRERLACGLLEARILVRRSAIREANEALSRIAGEPEAQSSVRWFLLRGLTAQHLGELDEAEATFRQALDLARGPAEHFRAYLSLAVAAAWRGDGDRSRELLLSAEAERPDAETTDRGRLGWVRMLGLILEFRFDEAADVGRHTLRILEDSTDDDLRLMVALLTTLALAETSQVSGARRLYEDAVGRAAERGTLRQRLALLYQGVVRVAEGDPAAAAGCLEEARLAFVRHGDLLNASLAAHYLGRARLALEDHMGALDAFERAAGDATSRGLATLAPHALCMQAAALQAAGRGDEGRPLAQQALASPRATRLTRELARSLARGDDLTVDLESGRLASADREVHGRPVACSILACLAGARGRIVSAEDLYRDVWHGTEYHPLRHRNTVYVAMSRLRRTLSDLIPGREIVERVPTGWRLAPGVGVHVVGRR